jgi:hypothetical protein
MNKSLHFFCIFISLLAVISVLISCNGTVASNNATGNITKSVSDAPDFKVMVNRVDEDFPNSLKFYLEASGTSPISAVALEYQVIKRTLAPEITRVDQQFNPGKQINLSWTWEMKKSGSIPPGAGINWNWKMTDTNGKTYTTPPGKFDYTDTRFSWKLKTTKLLDIYSSDQPDGMVDIMTAGLESRLATIKLPADFPANEKPRIFLYANPEEIKGAVLFQADWMGALAYHDYNIILIPCSVERLSWCSVTLAHEVTHLIVRQYIFGPFGDLPTWLNEGLARYSEGEMSDYDRQILKTAISGGRTISIRSLAGTFPANTDAAGLAYAESGSIVSYMITTGGWEKMQSLLTTFKEGSTADKALLAVYGYNTTTLEKQWLEWVKK